MTPAATQPATSAGDPVHMALDDSEVRDGLRDHALAILAQRLADRPAAFRIEAAADAVQETQLRALQKCHDYNPTLSVRAWLHGIMNLVLLEAVRTIRGLPAQESADSAAWERLAADVTPDTAKVVFDRLAAAEYLAKLPGEYQQIIHLRFTDELSHEEIAARLGISIGNARVRLWRAVNAAKTIAGAAPQEDRP